MLNAKHYVYSNKIKIALNLKENIKEAYTYKFSKIGYNCNQNFKILCIIDLWIVVTVNTKYYCFKLCILFLHFHDVLLLHLELDI